MIYLELVAHVIQLFKCLSVPCYDFDDSLKHAATLCMYYRQTMDIKHVFHLCHQDISVSLWVWPFYIKPMHTLLSGLLEGFCDFLLWHTFNLEFTSVQFFNYSCFTFQLRKHPFALEGNLKLLSQGGFLWALKQK